MGNLDSFTFTNGPDTKIDFDEGNLPAGTIITDQFEGISISTSSKFGVMIFDTNHPTGGDHDLGAGIGNALIISEDGDSSDPDDNAAGGTISLNFEQLATVTKIGLLDIDELGGSVRLFDEQSNLIEVREIAPTGNGHLQYLGLNVPGVARMDIHLAGSGALTELNFFQEEALIAPTQLTDIGWEKNGQLLGIWTNGNDIVQDLVAGIEVPFASNVTANTLQGDDLIYGKVSSGNGLLNQGIIIMDSGNDEITGVVEVEGSGDNNTSIANQGRITMGSGNDEITGVVEVEGSGNRNLGISNGISNIEMGAGEDKIVGIVEVKENGNDNQGISNGEATILTGDDNDRIEGTVTVEGSGNGNSGIFSGGQGGIIEMGAGNDKIIGVVEVEGNGNNNRAIENDDLGPGFSSIDTGDGNDQIYGIVTVEGDGDDNFAIFNGRGIIEMGAGDDEITGLVEIEGNGDNNLGILNDGTIDMGAGNDKITGSGPDAFTGFGSLATEFDDIGEIDLGEGNDKIIGFGQQIVDGGTGIDTAEFEFKLDESIILGSNDINSIDITANQVTMSFTNMEEFVFANGSFTLDDLLDLI